MSISNKVHTKNEKAEAIRRRRDIVMREDEEEEMMPSPAIKTKLEVSQPGDAQEQEADRIARKVVDGGDANISQLSATGSIQSKSEGDTLHAPEGLQRQLDSSKGSGESLPENVQQDLGGKMGADLGDVKIHRSAEASNMAESVNAKAFTHGQDIYFKNGNYDPGSKAGKELLAHEVVHTQQNLGGGVGRKIQRKFEPSEYDEIIAGYLRSLKDIADYYNVPYDKLREINKEAYATLFSARHRSGAPDARQYFDFDKKILLPEYPVFLPKGKLLSHQDTGNKAFSSRQFNSYHFRNSNNQRLLKVLRGEEQIEVGESDPPVRGGRGEDAVNKQGRIYLIQYALYTLGEIESNNQYWELDGNFVQGGRLHTAIGRLQREWGIIPAYSNNKRYASFAAQGLEDYLYGIIDAETIMRLDQMVLEYEKNNMGFAFDYGTTPDTFEGKASPYEFSMYERGSQQEEEFEYTKQEIDLNSDPFEVLVFSHPTREGGSQIEMRLTYTGNGTSNAKYISHFSSRGYGRGSEIYEFRYQKLIEPFPPTPNRMELPILKLPPLEGIETAKLKKGPESKPTVKNTFGYRMGNTDAMLYIPPDNPYGMAQPWQPWSVSVSDTVEFDETWIPSARVHKLKISTENWSEVVPFIIVPNLAEKASDLNDPSMKVDFEQSAKMDGKASLLIAKDMITTLTSSLGLPGRREEGGVPWLIEDSYIVWTPKVESLMQDVLYDINHPKDINPRNAGALAETLTRAYNSLSTFLVTYAMLPADQRAAVDANLLELEFNWGWAVQAVYYNVDEGLSYVIAAEKIGRFVKRQIEMLEVQTNGGMEERLNRAAITYYDSRHYFVHSAAVAIVDKELKRALLKNEQRRARIWSPGQPIENPVDESMGLDTSIVIGLIDVLSIQALYERATDMIDKSDDYTFAFWSVDETTSGFLYELYQGQTIDKMLAGFAKGGIYAQAIASQELGRFYMEISKPEFNKNITDMFKEIESVMKWNSITDAILTNLIAFVAAEILTMGAATLLLIPGIARIGGGVMSVIRVANASKWIEEAFTITAFTMISREMSEGTENESKNSLAEDLFTNFAMIRFMKVATPRFAKLFSKFIPTAGKGGKFVVGQLSALSSLQLFAEGHHLLKEGRMMDGDERFMAFFNNLGLHAAISISGFLVARPKDIIYKRISNKIFQGNPSQGLKTHFENLQGMRTELANAASEMMAQKGVTKKFIDKLAEYFKAENALDAGMREQLKTLEGKEGTEAREMFEKENQRMAEELQQFMDAIQLNMSLMGLDMASPGGGPKLFTLKAADRLSIREENLQRVKDMLTGEKGMKAEVAELSKDKLFKVLLPDGTIFFIEVEGRIKTPYEVAEEKLGPGGWNKASNAFWGDPAMKEFEAMKGSEQTNLLIKKMLEEGWRPEEGKPVDKKYVEEMRKIREKRKLQEEQKKQEDEQKREEEERQKQQEVLDFEKVLQDKYPGIYEKFSKWTTEFKTEFYEDFGNKIQSLEALEKEIGLVDVWKDSIRTDNINELREYGSKANLRDEYINEIDKLKPLGIKMLADGNPKRIVAEHLCNERRRITTEFKHATPPDLLEWIYKFNIERYEKPGYGDKWGQTWEGAQKFARKKALEKNPDLTGEALDNAIYDIIIQGSSHALGKKEKLGQALNEAFKGAPLEERNDLKHVLQKYRMWTD